MTAILQAIAALFGQGIGQKIGAGLSNITALAALAPIALWLIGNDANAVAVSLTWRELAMISGLLFAVVKVAHYTRSPGGGGQP